MSNKSTETFKGQTDTSQMFSNFFDNLTKGSFHQASTGEQIAKTSGVGTSDVMGTTKGTSTGTTEGTSTGTATTENRYEFKGDEDTQDIKDYRAALSKQNEGDPSIKYGAAAAMRAARNRFQGPFGMGAGQSAAARQSMFQAESGGIREQEGQNLIKDAFNRRQQQLGGMATLAGLTKRQLVNVGGTTTSTGATTGKTASAQDSTSTQTGKTTQDTTSVATNKSDTTGENTSESMGFGGGEQTGHQTEASTRTASTPMWGQLLGAAAQVGAAGASKGAI